MQRSQIGVIGGSDRRYLFLANLPCGFRADIGS